MVGKMKQEISAPEWEPSEDKSVSFVVHLLHALDSVFKELTVWKGHKHREKNSKQGRWIRAGMEGWAKGPRNQEEDIVSAELLPKPVESRTRASTMEFGLKDENSFHGSDLMLCRAWPGAQIFLSLLLFGPIGILVLGPAIRWTQVLGQLRERG